MSIHALCPNSPCATKLFLKIPYTTIEACNEHSSHAFYTQHTPIQNRERFWLPQQRSHQPSAHPFFTCLSISFILPCISLLSACEAFRHLYQSGFIFHCLLHFQKQQTRLFHTQIPQQNNHLTIFFHILINPSIQP
jgi:hypothetical protein